MNNTPMIVNATVNGIEVCISSVLPNYYSFWLLFLDTWN
jgi:hypothetical protein